MDFVYFLGRLHVVVLHLPLGIIVAVFVLEWLARKEQYRYLAAASPFLWGATAISALVTVLFGYMHFAEGGFDGPSGSQHRTFGTIFAVLVTLVALLRSSKFASNCTVVSTDPLSAVKPNWKPTLPDVDTSTTAPVRVSTAGPSTSWM